MQGLGWGAGTRHVEDWWGGGGGEGERGGRGGGERCGRG